MKSLSTPGVLLVSAVVVALSFSGCGGPDIGVTGNEIKIGTWTPLTGPAADLSTITRAMEAHFAYVNAEGGIHGRKLSLIVKDDAYNPSRTPEVVKQLVEEDRVFAILGGNGTANCLAVKPYLEMKFIPWINPGSGSRVWTTPVNAYVFSIFPAYVTEGRILASYAVNELQGEKIGLFYQDDSFGHEGQEGVRLGLRDAGKDLEIAVAYQVGTEALSSQAQQFKEAGVDAVLLWTIPEGAAALVREFEQIEDFQPKLLASQILSDPLMFELAGEGWEGAIVASGVPDPESDEPQVVRARELLAQYGADVQVGAFAMLGLSRSELLVEGLRRAGPELTRLKLIHALESMDGWSDNFLGRPISFSAENHQGLNAVRLMRATEGRYVYLTDWLE
ncbi:MAG: ABC transporter substrate-binding protein [Acidobacteriota bacterium]